MKISRPYSHFKLKLRIPMRLPQHLPYPLSIPHRQNYRNIKQDGHQGVRQPRPLESNFRSEKDTPESYREAERLPSKSHELDGLGCLGFVAVYYVCDCLSDEWKGESSSQHSQAVEQKENKIFLTGVIITCTAKQVIPIATHAPTQLSSNL
jgi:hypothetical protein